MSLPPHLKKNTILFIQQKDIDKIMRFSDNNNYKTPNVLSIFVNKKKKHVISSTNFHLNFIIFTLTLCLLRDIKFYLFLLLLLFWKMLKFLSDIFFSNYTKSQ